jgi:putative ABC transport system permease protein
MTFLRKLVWRFRRRKRERELHEELEFHLDVDKQEREAEGLDGREAHLAARRDLGSLALVAENTRTTWGWSFVEQCVQDVQYGLRAFVRSPGFTFAGTTTLAIGIGMTTAIFSVVYGMLLRPLPLHESDRLVLLTTLDGTDESGALSPPNFMSLKESIDHSSRSFSDFAGFEATELTLTGAGEAERIRGARVSGEFFQVLGATPILGRTFLLSEHNPGNTRVAVLGHRLWQRQFGGSRTVLGRHIVLNGIPHDIIGVMAPGCTFPYGSDIWIPQTYGGYLSSSSIAGRKSNTLVDVIGRLGPGIDNEQARAELHLLARRLEDRFPATNTGVTFGVVPLRDDLVGDVRPLLLLLLGAVVLVLVLASANVAGLLLARGASRRDEIAVRSALGAGRSRIVRQLVTEALVLGLFGNLLGLAIAYAVSGSLRAAYSDGLQRLGLSDAIRVDAPILAFACGITLVASALAALVPALRTAGYGIVEGLQSGGRNRISSRQSERWRGGLVSAQLAIAVVLLAGAGLLMKSFVRLASVDAGIRPERVLTFRLSTPATSYRGPTTVTFFDHLIERLERHHDVESAAAVFRLPIRQSTFGSRFRLEHAVDPEQRERSIGVQVVTPQYFDVLGVRIVSGRALTSDDRAGARPVVLINETGARRFFGDANPIGRQLRQFSYDPLEDAAEAFTIVGVVADVRTSGLGEELEPEAFFAHAQVPQGQMFVAVRTTGDPLDLTSIVRSEVAGLDRGLPVQELHSMDEVVSASLSRQRLLTRFVSLFSVVALVLAAVGIFGLVSFSVTERTREIGVRIALGASWANAIGPIVSHTVVLVGAGLMIGLGGAAGLTRLLEQELFGVTPLDPSVFAGVVALLAVVAVVASLVPAWRAATVNPLVALRAE